MTTSSDAAEQLMRFYLEGAEFALKISGSATKNIIAILYAISQDKNKTKGKIRLSNMLKTGKELKIFSVKKDDIKKFYQEAKRYGVLYCALKDIDKNNPDGMIDIMVRAEDAPKINRIVERFNLTTINSADIKNEIEMSKNIKQQSNKNNTPSITKTENDNLSKDFLKTKGELEGRFKEKDKESVREKIRDIKKEFATKDNSGQLNKDNYLKKRKKIKNKNEKSK